MGRGLALTHRADRATAVPAQRRWWFATATGDRPELFCYTRELSLVPGDLLELRVHTTADRFAVRVLRDGHVAQEAVVLSEVDGKAHTTGATPYRDGCGWPVTLALPTRGWRPGGYVVIVTATVDGVELRHEHWIALRPWRLRRDRLTLVASTCTWNAYNGWGGASHYHGIDGAEGEDVFSPVLSFDRPLQAGVAWLPPGAPRMSMPLREPDAQIRYDAIDWALAHGRGKHCASAGWATFERHFVRWAEHAGYGVDVISQHDLHFRPDLLETAGPLVFVGHDEYWTRRMREHVDAFVDGGGQVARLGGNFQWQVRLSDDGLRQTCFKSRAAAEDPVREDPRRRHLLTTLWDAPEVGYPGAQTFGCSAIRGVYAAFGGMAARASGGFTVYRPEHWTLAGTQLGYGDLLGADSRAVAYEVDGLDHVIRDGLPYATGADGIDPDTVEIVGLCLATNREQDHGVPGTQLDVGDDDLPMIAEARYGAVTPVTLERATRGCGVLAEYRRGRGRVVSAASIEWVNGLRLRDAGVERVTRNVLDRLSGRVR